MIIYGVSKAIPNLFLYVYHENLMEHTKALCEQTAGGTGL
jgi:hypothetical protein